MCHVKVAALALGLAASIPFGVCAQALESEPATTFADLALRLPERSFVIVTDQRGRQTEGELTGVDGDTLSVETAGRAVTFTRPEVQQVQRKVPDSFLNGALIGLAIGTAGPLIVCTSIGDSSETAGCVTGSLGFGGLSGFVIGAIVDRLHTRKVTLFRSANGRPGAVTISPVMGRRAVGVLTSLRLGR